MTILQQIEKAKTTYFDNFLSKVCLFLIFTEGSTKYIKCIPFKATNMGYRLYQNISIGIYD